MPAWNELLTDLEAQPTNEAKAAWLARRFPESLASLAQLRGRNVLVYASAFLQKPTAHPLTLQITPEDINGLMATIHGMDWSKGLTLVLHTPGGVTNATETIVSYLWSKFEFIEVIVPTYAMSAGTMISLAADQIIMGRQSQLGPIDPQMQVGGRSTSARGIVDQFEQARKEILANQQAAHVWAPILSGLGPSLMIDARNALVYGERMVGEWLAGRMFKDAPDPKAQAAATAKHFNDADTHKSHGRRIGRDEARAFNVKVIDLEADPQLQEAVLTCYHLVTLVFEKTPTVKLMASNHGRMYVKNLNAPPPAQQPPPPGRISSTDE